MSQTMISSGIYLCSISLSLGRGQGALRKTEWLDFLNSVAVAVAVAVDHEEAEPNSQIAK